MSRATRTAPPQATLEDLVAACDAAVVEHGVHDYLAACRVLRWVVQNLGWTPGADHAAGREYVLAVTSARGGGTLTIVLLPEPVTWGRYLRATGAMPVDDDLERANCSTQGRPGHLSCGWCQRCNLPRMSCGDAPEARAVADWDYVVATVSAVVLVFFLALATKPHWLPWVLAQII